LVVIRSACISNIAKVEFRDVHGKSAGTELVEIGFQRRLRSIFQLKSVTLYANAVNKTTVVQQFDNGEVLRRARVVVYDSVIIDEEFGIRTIPTCKFKRFDHPIPAGSTCSTKCVNVISIPRSARRIMQRLVNDIDKRHIWIASAHRSEERRVGKETR